MIKPLSALLIILLISPRVFALSDTQKHYQQLLNSYNASQIKQAAQSIVRHQETDIQTLDTLAEVLVQRYPNNLEHDRDALAWACRALGESNNARYSQVMQDIVASNAHAKLKKYAKKALSLMDTTNIKPSNLYQPGTVKLQQPKSIHLTNKATPSTESTRDQIQRGIIALANQDLHSIKRLAQQMHSVGSDSLELSDALAQFVVNHYKMATNRNSDTLAWSCKGLAGAGTTRYLTLLDEVVSNTNSHAMRKHCAKARKRIMGQQVMASFEPGSIDLQALAKKHQ